MKKKLLIIFILSIIPTLIFTADDNYTLLSPLPNVSDSNGVVDINTYIPKMFNLLIGVGAGLSFVMLAYEGFLYMFTDSFKIKADMLGKIKQTLGGLFLVIISYALVYEINPKALNLQIHIEEPSVNTSRNYVFAGFVDVPYGDEEKTRKELKDRNVEINNGNKTCENGQTRGCTNVAGLSMAVVSGLGEIKNQCNCTVQITGGTEGGHTTHGVGQPNVDLNPTSGLNQFLGVPDPYNPPKEAIQKRKLPDGTIIDVVQAERKINGRTVVFEFEKTGAYGRATGDHWHTQFK